MPARQQETPSAQLGALLLRGHTMLAECCQDCNIPLMRDPATLQSLCVGCHRSFTPAEVQALNAPQQPQEQPPAAEPAAVSGPLHAAAPGAVPATAGQPRRAMNGPLTSALARHHRRTNSNGGSSDGGAASPNLLPAQAPITPAGAASAGTLSPQSTDTPAAGAAAAANGYGNAAGVQQLMTGSIHSQVGSCLNGKGATGSCAWKNWTACQQALLCSWKTASFCTELSVSTCREEPAAGLRARARAALCCARACIPTCHSQCPD